MNTEQEVINVIKQHYQICNGYPAPLQALKVYYGKPFHFESLGLGKWTTWWGKNNYLFEFEQVAVNLVVPIMNNIVTEEELLVEIKLFFSKSEMFYHRRQILSHLRTIYGKGSFGNFGYGTFRQFSERHGLDMGIARREDFKRPSEWNSWRGRVM
jgi:hypothetical protein